MASKVLIIDDDSRNIFALTAVLKAKGYECISAISAAEGFQLLEKNTDVAVILMDMMMPEMDGYQAIAEMSRTPEFKHLPVIAVTAQAMVGDRDRCLQAGAAGYVAKPINVEELVSLLKKYI